MSLLSLINPFRFTMSSSLSLARVAATLPFTYTGADFYALCSDAMLKAVTRQASAIDAKVAKHNSKLARDGRPITTAQFFDHYATKEDVAVVVTEEDFFAAQRELIPSVSAKELEHYKRVREQFESVDGKTEEPAAQAKVPESEKLTAVPHRPRINGRLRS